MKPCKHLEHDPKKYPSCKFIEIYPGVFCFERKPITPGGATRVQFCKKKGRINAIFDCYEPPGPSGCHEEIDNA